MEALYPDSGSVNDSKEGGLEKLEEVRAGEGGCDSVFHGAPPPQTFGPGFRQLLWCCLPTGTHLSISSLDRLTMTAVLTRLIQSPLLVPWSFVQHPFHHYFQSCSSTASWQISVNLQFSFQLFPRD